MKYQNTCSKPLCTTVFPFYFFGTPRRARAWLPPPVCRISHGRFSWWKDKIPSAPSIKTDPDNPHTHTSGGREGGRHQTPKIGIPSQVCHSKSWTTHEGICTSLGYLGMLNHLELSNSRPWHALVFQPKDRYLHSAEGGGCVWEKYRSLSIFLFSCRAFFCCSGVTKAHIWIWAIYDPMNRFSFDSHPHSTGVKKSVYAH